MLLFQDFWDLKTEDIGWLFIDEAGQATPQSAIGAIWRSRNVVVVGDPLQIPPVVTLSDDQLKLIANESAGITSESSFFYHLTRSEVSVQEFADLNNKFGGTMSDSKNNTKWLGSPLRVHRRCDSSMFEICNKTTYQDKMLHATKNKDMVEDPMYMSQWFNIEEELLVQETTIFLSKEKAIEIANKFTQNNPGKIATLFHLCKCVVQKLKQINKNAVENKK